MKKLLAVLGGLAAVAAVVPFAHKKDEHSGEETYHALIWNAHIAPVPTEEGKRDVTINLGVTNPFSHYDEYKHYDDEALFSSPAEERDPGQEHSDEIVYF